MQFETFFVPMRGGWGGGGANDGGGHPPPKEWGERDRLVRDWGDGRLARRGWNAHERRLQG